VSPLWTRGFWFDTAERCTKTAAQSLIATLALGTGLLDVDWTASVSVAALATVLSLLTSVASAGVGDPRTASLVTVVSPAGRHAESRPALPQSGTYPDGPDIPPITTP
jgi:hypothetical protein